MAGHDKSRWVERRIAATFVAFRRSCPYFVLPLTVFIFQSHQKCHQGWGFQSFTGVQSQIDNVELPRLVKYQSVFERIRQTGQDFETPTNAQPL